MKNLFVTIILLILSVGCFAQKIHFSDTSNRWTVELEYWDAGVYTEVKECHYSTDSVLNGLKYHKLEIFNSIAILIREDTVLKKVYYKRIQPAGDTAEGVLYDYNLIVGDSVTHAFGSNVWRHGVVAVDSVLINSVYHKIWKFSGRVVSGTETVGDYTVVEGIGCIHSNLYGSPLLMPLRPLGPFEHFEHTICFVNQFGAPLVSPAIPYPWPVYQHGYQKFDNNVSCSITPIGLGGGSVNETQPENGIVYVMPNPATSASQIVFSQPIESGYLLILNIFGQTVLRTEIKNQGHISIGKYISTPGQYFYRLTDANKNQSYTGKFIFE